VGLGTFWLAKPIVENKTLDAALAVLGPVTKLAIGVTVHTFSFDFLENLIKLLNILLKQIDQKD
jgi:hypothetical protein